MEEHARTSIQKSTSQANAEYLDQNRALAQMSPPPLQLTPDRPRRTERERPERERPESERLDPGGTYGTPYANWAEAAAAESFLRTTLIPAELAMFGSDVAGLYASFLSREPGDSLARAVFNPGSDLSEEFTDCYVMQVETEELMNDMARYLNRFVLPANQWVRVSIEAVYGTPRVERNINYNNPYDAPGNIAGGYGRDSSAAGDDVRYARGWVEVNRVTDTEGRTTNIFMRNRLYYICLDCVDFVPGNPGTGLEQTFTIPLSRLEASGWAFDKPFRVNYEAPALTKTYPPGSLNLTYPQNAADRNRTGREPREESERDTGRRRADLGQPRPERD